MNYITRNAQIIERIPGEFHLELVDSVCREKVAISSRSSELRIVAHFLGYHEDNGTLCDATWFGHLPTGDMVFPDREEEWNT